MFTMTYDLEYDSEYDAYRFNGNLFACAKALRFMFPKAGEKVTLVLYDSKPGVKITISDCRLDVGSWWRRKTYIDFYPRFEEEMYILRRREPYYVRMECK